MVFLAKSSMSKHHWKISILVVLIVSSGYLFADWYHGMPEDVEKHFVGRQSCIECHQTQAALFHGSDHDLAMDVANEQTVLADFNDQTIEHYGIESRMYRDGSKFMVHTEGPTGQMQDFEVKYVFGIRPLQQYMVELERPKDAKPNEIGRVQVLRISWDTEAKQWFYLRPPDVDEKLDPDDPLHWTGITQNWNASCAVCHSTDLKKNFSPLTNEYHTTFSEIDVSCEACHGEGSLHVELANQNSLFWDRKHHYGLAKLKTESNVPQVESCAPCHSRRTPVDDSFRPGCNFDDYYATQLLTDPIYHADGQIRDEDYVYGSFIQSKMYHEGIRCTDCHDAHSAKVRFDNNLLCTSCHQHPSGKYDSPAHHHHQPGTPGASCIECHMPATTYMMVDPRRDHSFRVPRPDLSVRFGTPNACTACHLSDAKLTPNSDRKPLTQYLDWIIAAESGDQEVGAELDRIDSLMTESFDKWYPVNTSEPRSRYYEQLAMGRSDDEAAVPTLNELATDERAPAIFRASALAVLMGDSDPESLTTAIEAFNDSSPKVIVAALMRVDMEIARLADRQRYGNADEVDREQIKRLAREVAPLLTHPSRRVRIDAARVFVGLPNDVRQNDVEPDRRKAFELALEEYKRSLYIDGDRAGNHMMLGGLHEMLGDPARAKDDYRAAMTVEPNLAGPRSNLAALLEADANRLNSELRQSPSGGGIAVGEMRSKLKQIQSIGRQIARIRAEEHELLRKDIVRSHGLPDTHGLHYRFAMSSYVQRELESTEKHLLEAHRQQPDNQMYLMGLATYYIHVEKPDVALQYIDQLTKLDAQHPGYQALANQAKQMMKNAGDASDSTDQ